MKKIKILIIIILSTLFVYFVMDYIEYKINVKNYINKKADHCKAFKIPSYSEYLFKNNLFTNSVVPFKNYLKEMYTMTRRDIIAENSKKSPILIFGCSFAYGSFLNENETFGYKLSQTTKRSIYNKAIPGCAIQHMYHFLKDKNFYNTIKEPPEYIIYVYIPEHMRRLYYRVYPDTIVSNGAYLRYSLKNNSLKLEKSNPFLYKSFIFKNYIYNKDDKISYSKERKYKNFSLANELFIQSRKLILQHYPNAKFIILRYNMTYDENGLEVPFMWDVLKKEGFTIINTEELIGRKLVYGSDDTTVDKYHPSEKAWDIVVPKLAEKLNL